MTFYERFEMLCAEHGMKPQNKEIQRITEVSSTAISGWKKGALPKADVICRLAKYFQVTTDYLLGASKVRSLNLSEEETLLLEAYQTAATEGKFKIIQVCMNERGNCNV